MALAFVHVASRRLFVSPCSLNPTEAWVGRQAGAFAAHARAGGCGAPLVLRDNDQLYKGTFDAALAAGGARVKRLAFRSPNTNAYVERFVQSVKQECLDHFALCGPEHADHLVHEYLAYYSHERPHQGKGNRPLDCDGRDPPGEGRCGAASGWAGCCGTTGKPRDYNESAANPPIEALLKAVRSSGRS